jgi:tetratricopeptide (TPR) repeat protein
MTGSVRQSPPQAPQPQAQQPTTHIAHLLPAVVLALVSFAVYFNALFGEFVYDDEYQVVNNPWLRSPSNLLTPFVKDVWAFRSAAYPNIRVPVFQSRSNYYRPLMHTIYTICYRTFGLNAIAYHVVNVLFHCGVTVIVFLILRRLLPESRTSVYISAPFLAALLFAVHPIHTEAVTWIACLPDVAFTFLYLLSLYFYTKSGMLKSGSYVASVGCFALAAFFKEPALTLPAILFAYDLTLRQERPSWSDCAKRFVPYFAVAAVYFAMRISALGAFKPGRPHHQFSAHQNAINVFPLFANYLGKLLLPVNLNAFYVLHPVTSLQEWRELIALAVTAGAVALWVVAFRKNKVAFLSILLLVLPLLPVLYIPAVGENTFAERYLYLPSVGYVFLLALFISWAALRLPNGARVIATAFLLLAGAFAIGTVNRNKVWQNEYTLWADTVESSPESAFAHCKLGHAYRHRKMPREAIEQFQAAVGIAPGYADAHDQLGGVYEDLGMYDKALPELKAAELLNPNHDAVHYNLGLLYCNLGQKDNARIELTRALAITPDDRDTLELLRELSH